MKTVYHPTLPATQEVDDKDVDAWVEQGWLKSKPKAVAEAEASADQKGSNR